MPQSSTLGMARFFPRVNLFSYGKEVHRWKCQCPASPVTSMTVVRRTQLRSVDEVQDEGVQEEGVQEEGM